MTSKYAITSYMRYDEKYIVIYVHRSEQGSAISDCLVAHRTVIHRLNLTHEPVPVFCARTVSLLFASVAWSGSAPTGTTQQERGAVAVELSMYERNCSARKRCLGVLYATVSHAQVGYSICRRSGRCIVGIFNQTNQLCIGGIFN